MPKPGKSKRRKSHPGLGPRKGGAFEREICVKFSLWVSNGKRRDLFWRSAMSGGRATIGWRKGIELSSQAGDLVAVHPMGVQLTGRFFIECKHRRVNYDLFLLKGEGQIKTWWEKAKTQAKQYGLIPMMIVKGNGKPILLIVPDGKLVDYCPNIGCITAPWLPDIHLFDDVMKCQFRRQSIPRYMLKEHVA